MQYLTTQLPARFLQRREPGRVVVRGVLPATPIGASRDAVLALPEMKAVDARQAECAVCLEDFEADDKLKTTPCSHSFHDRYISDWLRIFSSVRNRPDPHNLQLAVNVGRIGNRDRGSGRPGSLIPSAQSQYPSLRRLFGKDPEPSLQAMTFGTKYASSEEGIWSDREMKREGEATGRRRGGQRVRWGGAGRHATTGRRAEGEVGRRGEA
ncbi:hypothetical protein GUJ93_ZPchr0011g27437 [Zizania palustris]|uniref:RING-type domain-containing protein n=1 Tax=Zizania palustris TaxID=103762 RepID=A0A8J5WIN9_ZIZPA|nr:hypothetical protein GUJ93_ZPchr0011g27437 [Zizania palustris]